MEKILPIEEYAKSLMNVSIHITDKKLEWKTFKKQQGKQRWQRINIMRENHNIPSIPLSSHHHLSSFYCFFLLNIHDQLHCHLYT